MMTVMGTGGGGGGMGGGGAAAAAGSGGNSYSRRYSHLSGGIGGSSDIVNKGKANFMLTFFFCMSFTSTTIMY